MRALINDKKYVTYNSTNSTYSVNFTALDDDYPTEEVFLDEDDSVIYAEDYPSEDEYLENIVEDEAYDENQFDEAVDSPVEEIYVEQLQAFTKVDRDPRERVITIAFTAFVRQEDYGYVKGGDDAKEAKWFSVNELPPLAFDHEYILKIALERLRNKIRLEPIAFHLLNKTFTMTQVQSIYEAVLEQKYDRRNFHKKMTALGYIIPTGDKQTANGRPGNLYSFDEDKYNEEVNKRSAI